MIKAIAIDDEPRALEVIKNHVAKVPFLELSGVFTNPFEALDYINKNRPDLIFLDIKMPDISGIDFLRTLNKGNQMVIFTTAHSAYALESYELDALDYLLKPFEFSRFLKSVSKAQEKLKIKERPVHDFFFINTGQQQQKVFFKEINRIEGDGNYVNYWFNSKKFMVRSTLKETLQLLPAGMFVQIHRSYIIPLHKIDKIQDNHVFIGDESISIGANFKDELMRLIGKPGQVPQK